MDYIVCYLHNVREFWWNWSALGYSWPLDDYDNEVTRSVVFRYL